MGKLTGKVALVAGGSNRIGLAAARRFAEHGAQVLITGPRRERVDAAIAQIGHGATGVVGERDDIAHHDAAVTELVHAHGGVDIYLAAAHVSTIVPVHSVLEAEYDGQFANNARGLLYGIQRTAPAMREGGAIVITGAVADAFPAASRVVHAGARAAVLAFARVWADELKTRQIRVNVISANAPDELRLCARDRQQTPLAPPARHSACASASARSEALADAALFLASDASRFITGIHLRVGGGVSLL